jgi:hypothetical protein
MAPPRRLCPATATRCVGKLVELVADRPAHEHGGDLVGRRLVASGQPVARRADDLDPDPTALVEEVERGVDRGR